ncbi:hypothetical protein J6590_026291 [Homalodisca vitripennis]|nr:hypothetical protein J6590_026291 [Homalodisca vitripennis]
MSRRCKKFVFRFLAADCFFYLFRRKLLQILGVQISDDVLRGRRVAVGDRCRFKRYRTQSLNFTAGAYIVVAVAGGEYVPKKPMFSLSNFGETLAKLCTHRVRRRPRRPMAQCSGHNVYRKITRSSNVERGCCLDG